MQALAGNTQGALEVAQRQGPSMHIFNVKGKLAEEVVAKNANHLIGSAARQDKIYSVYKVPIYSLRNDSHQDLVTTEPHARST